MPLPLQTLLINFSETYWERPWLESLTPDVKLDYHFNPDLLDTARSALVIVNDIGNQFGDQAAAVLRRFEAAGRPAGVIHLGDECYHCDTAYYANAKFAVRNYYRPNCVPARDGHVRVLPLGCKPGFVECLEHKPITDRRHRWSFAGEIKGRRVNMLKQMTDVPDGFVFRTRQWNDPNALTTESYAKLMTDSVFVPCPRGNDSVDCFRVYEALEAGAIPVVEDDGKWANLLDVVPVLPMSIRTRYLKRGNAWFRGKVGPSYWQSLYGVDFPVPRVWDWADAPKLVRTIDAPAVQATCRAWWEKIKAETRQWLNTLLRDHAAASAD